MDGFDDEPEHPKKKRRRQKCINALSSRLTLDAGLRGDAAVLSDDLWADLVGKDVTYSDSRNPWSRNEKHGAYVSITPKARLVPYIEDVPWTIFPARQLDQQEASEVDTVSSTIRLPVISSGTQRFLKTLETTDTSRPTIHTQKPIEIRTLSTKPLSLDTVFVSVQKDLLESVDEIQRRFGGGFQRDVSKRLKSRSNSIAPSNGSPNGISSGEPPDAEARLKVIVREGLSKLSLIHSGNVFALPLPSHPITHVPAPPAIVTACEPVVQGLLTRMTKIILIKARSSEKKALKHLKQSRVFVPQVVENETEDTSNETFYSAAEDKENGDTSDGAEDTSQDGFESADSMRSISDDASDDSLDDMIQLSPPSLPPTQSDTLSPPPRPDREGATGTQTPGSIYSTFTSTTTRAGPSSGKLFKSEVLLQRFSNDALHPRPADEDDDDSFVYVDINTLAKIGCFSGDWARLEASKNERYDGVAALEVAGPNTVIDRNTDWRLVRVFGLPGLSKSSPRYAIDRCEDCRSSLSQMPLPVPAPTVRIPPMLLSNLGDPQFVRLATIPESPALSTSWNSRLHSNRKAVFNPPVAKEVTLFKISTPFSTIRDLQSALFASLKRYFESKRRLVKQGDLIGVAVDGELGKLTYSSAHAGDLESAHEDLILHLNSVAERRSRRSGIAWFSIHRLCVESDPRFDNGSGLDLWAETALVDSTTTRMAQAGSSIGAVPKSAERHLQYWLGLKRIPPSSDALLPILSAEIPTTAISTLEKRLCDLVSATTSTRAINLGLPPSVILLHSTQRQIGKSYTAMSACSCAGVHLFPISAHDIASESSSSAGGGDVKSEGLLKVRAERAFTCGAQHTALLIQHIDVLTADRMFPALQEIISDARVIIATTTEIDKIPDSIRSLFTHELELCAPNERERENILRNACAEQAFRLDPGVNLRSVALKTAALVAGDLVDVVNRASLARSLRLEKLAAAQSVSMSDILVSGGPAASNILAEDFTAAMSHARSTFSDSIGAPKIPSVTWKDVGGLADQKFSIMETISLPLSRPDLFTIGTRKRSGILFYGPPGTGKTLLAKAIATEFSLNFFSVKGPELLNMYIGESEANVRRVFQRARDARPCVVFFDELDSVAPKRGNQGDSGGVMDRIVSQLLAELDGMSSAGGASDDNKGSGAGGNAGGVFVIGATNRPDLLDPALLRPGRFDKMLYLGVSSTHDQQATILEALTRKFSLAPDVDLRRVAQKLPFTYTGADLYALCSDAMLKAITRKTKMVDEKVEEASHIRGEEVGTAYFFDHLAKPEDLEVVVNEADFAGAQRELVASVSAKELAHFERIRHQFEQHDISKSPSSTAQTVPSKQPSTASLHSPKQPLAIRQPSNQTYAASITPPTRIPAPKSVQPEHVGSSNQGKGKAKGIANPDFGPDSSDHDDDYVIRTDHLHGSFNGREGNWKSKIDGFIDEEDRDLYT